MPRGISVGSAVISVNGRFAGRPMVALRISGGYAEVCDGKRRRMDKPKRKKLCHLSLLSPDAEPLAVDAGLTDGAIRRYLSHFRRADIPDGFNTIQVK